MLKEKGGGDCIKLIENEAVKLGLNKVKMEVYAQSTNAIGFYLYQGYSIKWEK